MKRVKLIFCLCAISLCFNSIKAAGTTRTTTGAGNFNTSGTWSPAGSPGNSDILTVGHYVTYDANHSVQGSLTVNMPLQDAVGGTAYNLIVQNSGTLTANARVSIEGNLTVQNDGIFTIAAGDTVYVGGNCDFKNDAVIMINTGAVLIVGGTLNIQNDVTTDLNGTIVVTGNMTTKNNAMVSSSTATGEIKVTGTVTTSNSSLIFGSGADCSSGPCNAKATSTLPIKLIEFTVVQNKDEVLLEWETAEELNNDYFTIERSTDGENYSPITKIKGSGTTTIPQTYFYMDNKPVNGNLYYRLRQTDIDGKTEVFAAKHISYEGKPKVSELIVSPTPATGSNFTMTFGNIKENVVVIMLDANGKEVFTKAFIETQDGVIHGRDLTHHINPGVYIIIASSDDKLVKQKIIIE